MSQRTRSSIPVEGNFRHGTYYGYSKKGCGCDSCEIANSVHSKESRNRNLSAVRARGRKYSRKAVAKDHGFDNYDDYLLSRITGLYLKFSINGRQKFGRKFHCIWQ